ncbi:MAG: hypothetical protein R6X20_04860 [Phycisphaerae bacterium]
MNRRRQRTLMGSPYRDRCFVRWVLDECTARDAPELATLFERAEESWRKSMIRDRYIELTGRLP